MTPVSEWKRQHFTKAMLRHVETRRLEESFEKAQKPWSRLRSRADLQRRKYFSRSQTLDMLNSKLNALSHDGAAPLEISKMKVSFILYFCR
jgi:hypothetical protein